MVVVVVVGGGGITLMLNKEGGSLAVYMVGRWGAYRNFDLSNISPPVTRYPAAGKCFQNTRYPIATV